MVNSDPILIPLLNPNEPEALLVKLYVHEGQRVAKGDLVCALETTKSTAEVVAEVDGYIASLNYTEGQSVNAGEVLCYLAGSPEWKPPMSSTPPAGPEPPPLPDGLRITEPALALAQAEGLDLARLPVGRMVTEAGVRSLLDRAAGVDFSKPHQAFDATAILIYGGGGHGKSLIDLIRVLGVYRIAGVVDDGLPAGESILGVPILGGAEILANLYTRGVRLAANAVGGIGNVAVRIKVFRQIAEAGFVCPALVHPTAYVEPSASLSPGVQVFPHAYIGSDARAGYGCIVNSGAIVSHDCQLGDYANISPGALLAGEVQVGSGALIGMGATLNLRVRVGANARVGNSATVKQDVPENGIVRAGSVWPE